jgi:hypothetical protein
VIVPTLNRERELRRALTSVQGQTFQDWECIVVDGASTVDIRGAVNELEDPRFRYVRREDTTGPTPARATAWQIMQGMYALHLDSDWELYPWALAQGVAYLQATPSVDLAIGLGLRHEDSRLGVRVADAPRISTPSEFRAQEPAPDRVAMVRAPVIAEWLALPGEYFAFEAVFTATAELSHCSIGLDEPWALCRTAGADRITTSPRGQVRGIEDAVTFLRECADLIADTPCLTVDRMLERVMWTLVRARRGEARLAARALRERGMSPTRAVWRQAAARLRRRIASGEPAPFWA